MKPIPPAGTAMFSRSTENYQHDKWYRRTVFNAPETVDSTALYPGPGAYDPMFKVHSKFKRSYNATICPGDKMARESLPAIDKHLRRSLVHEFLPIVGRDVRPFEGMTVTISRTQMHKWNMHEDAYHKTRGTIFEVAEDELTCMVVWDMPYPGPEEEYSLCNTGKEGKYWLAVPKPRPTTPIARRWVLDAIVSPRYEFDPGQGTFSIPSKKKVTQVQQERRKGVRNVVERGSIIAEVKAMVLLEAKLRDIEAEKQKRKQELLERMHIEMEKQRQMRAISLRTVADHREVDSDPLKNLFHMSGFERVPSEEETSRQIYEKLLSEQTDALDSQLKQDRKSQPRKAPSVKQHNDAPKLEPLSDETIEFLRSLLGIQRLFGRLVEIRQRIKAKAAKQIATEKEQSRVSSCSLSGIVRNRLMPAIDMSIYNKRREIRKEIRLKSRSVLVKDHHASTIYHHTPKRFHRPSGHLLQTLERLSQPRTEHQDTTLHNRDLKNTTLNRDLKDTALHNGDLKNKTKRSGKMQQAMRIWSPGDQKLHHDTEMVVLGEDEYLSAEFDEDVEDDEQKMFEVPAADTTGKEDGCRIQRQDLGICEDGGYVDQKSGDKPDGVVDGEQNNVKEGDGLSNVKEGDGLRLDESVEGDGTDCNQEALDEGGGCKTDANAEVGTKRNTGTAADVGKEVAIEHGGEEIAPGDDSAQDHSEEPQDHSEEPLDDSTQDHSEEPLVTMHDGQGEERNETVACTTPRRKSQLLEEMSALRENRCVVLFHSRAISVTQARMPPRWRHRISFRINLDCFRI